MIFRRSLLLSIDLQSNSLRAERQTAIRMLDTLEKEILSLSTLPNRVALTEEEPWHSAGIRKLPVKNYLVYFWVNEERK